LDNGDRVSAIVPIYSGKHLLSGRSSAELAAMTRAAKGDDGECVDYVRNIAARLANLGIDDPDIDEFWRALN
jgi:cation transport regulator ChaC